VEDHGLSVSIGEEEENEEDLSNGSFALRHVINELEERNKRFQYLRSLEKTGAVPSIDIRGILSDMSQKSSVTRHDLYKDFLGMVQDHYSLRDDCMETEDMLVKVRSMITDNAVTLKDLFTTPDDALQGESNVVPPISIDDHWTQDETKTGRNFYDSFVVSEEPVPEESPEPDEEYEEEVLDDDDDYNEDDELYDDMQKSSKSGAALSPKQLQEFLAETESADESGDSSPDGKRKRGRPKKSDMKPKIIVLTEVKEKRGRGRPRKKPPLTPGTLEVVPDPIIEESENKEKRKRGRPKKMRIAEFTITTETLGKVVEQLQVLQSPTHSQSSGPSTPTTPLGLTEQSQSQQKDLSQPKRKRGRPKKYRPELAENILLTDSTNDLESSSIYLSPENSLNFSANNETDSAEDSQNLSFGSEFNEAKLSKSESDSASSLTDTLTTPPTEKRKRGRPRKTRVDQPVIKYELDKPKYEFVEVCSSPLEDDSAVRRTRSTRKVLSYTEPEEDHDQEYLKEGEDEEDALNFTQFFESDDKSNSRSTRVRLNGFM